MQDNEQKLESVTETVISIPFGGSDDEDDFEDEGIPEEGFSFPCRMYTPPELTSRDLLDGPRLRMNAYHEAFGRCRNRIQEVLRTSRTPTVKRVVEAVEDAYVVREEDRLMPYTELRTIAISGSDRGENSSVLNDVRCVLEQPFPKTSELEEDAAEEDELRLKVPVVASTLTPSDCSNLTSAMKALVSGFLQSRLGNVGDEEGQDKRKLAPYDINLVKIWYNKLRRSRDETDLPKLVILVPELERIEPSVLQDIFYICSLHIPQLPFVLVLGLSTPPTPSYLHSAFPRKTLALLRLTQVEVSGRLDVLKHVLKLTFFDPSFAPTIVPSPAVLSFIVQQFTITTQSMDFVLSLLQLIHLRHFVDPLSILAQDELLGTTSIEEAAEKLSESSSRQFLLALLARLQHSEEDDKTAEHVTNGVNGFDDMPEFSRPKRGSTKKGKDKASDSSAIQVDKKMVRGVLTRVRELRRRHEKRLRASRVAFHVVSEIRNLLLKKGCVAEDPRHRKGVGTEVDLICAWFRGTVPSREGKVIVKEFQFVFADLVHLMRANKHVHSYSFSDLHFVACKILPSTLQRTFDEWCEESREDDSKMQEMITQWSEEMDDLLAAQDCGMDSDDIRDGRLRIEEDMCKWLQEYISENTRDFTEMELWDVWFTSNPTGIEELINPAPRAVIINALIHSERYLGNTYSPKPTSSERGRKSREGKSSQGADVENLLPDTALLFKGYLESGRMVNVYDWYMSFKESLDARRRLERPAEENSRARTRGMKDRQKAVKRLGLRKNERSISPSPSPTKGRGRGRGRGRGTRGRGQRGKRGSKNGGRIMEESESDSSEDESELDGNEDDLSPEERDRWEAEVQTRFIRSVQELDLLGFIKHTGRKVDHVQKTMYDLPDYN